MFNLNAISILPVEVKEIPLSDVMWCEDTAVGFADLSDVVMHGRLLAVGMQF